MPSIKDMVLQATAGKPTPMDRIHAFVLRMRPDTAKETIRARVYEHVAEGRVLRIAEGVYLTRDGPATLLMVEGDGWEALRAIDDDAVNLILTDQPYDLGTKAHLRGSSRPTGRNRGRSYPLRDLDAAWFAEAYRILTKTHAWRAMRGGERTGGGACVVFSPAITRSTWRHVRRLIDLAESCGFTYEGAIPWDKEKPGMGYSTGRNQHELMHVFTAGSRNGGIGWDLGFRNVQRHRALRRRSGGEEHESGKPPGLFMAVIRWLTRAGDVVLDPFAGEASWARLALAEGRHVVLVDRDRRWVERWAGA